MSFSVRYARPDEVDAISALDRALGASGHGDFDRERVEKEFALSFARWIVAEEASRLVGYLLLWRVEDEIDVHFVGVLPSERRRGVGRALVMGAIDLAESDQNRERITVRLEVRRSNIAARELYESLGFAYMGERPGYYADGEDGLTMERLPRG